MLGGRGPSKTFSSPIPILIGLQGNQAALTNTHTTRAKSPTATVHSTRSLRRPEAAARPWQGSELDLDLAHLPFRGEFTGRYPITY